MNITKMTNKLILNLLIGGGLLAGLASCADESIALTDVRYPTYERLANWFGPKNLTKTDVPTRLIGCTTKAICAMKKHKTT